MAVNCNIGHTKIQERAAIFMDTFITILNKLSTGESFVDISDAPLDSFEDVLTEPLQSAVTQHQYHISVFSRDDKDTWISYFFDDAGGVRSSKGSLSKVKKAYGNIIKSVLPDDDPFKIYGYMKIQYIKDPISAS